MIICRESASASFLKFAPFKSTNGQVLLSSVARQRRFSGQRLEHSKKRVLKIEPRKKLWQFQTPFILYKYMVLPIGKKLCCLLWWSQSYAVIILDAKEVNSSRVDWWTLGKASVVMFWLRRWPPHGRGNAHPKIIAKGESFNVIIHT